MSNQKLNLSGTGKEILELLMSALEVERPFAIKIALAKGISKGSNGEKSIFKDDKPKWTISESIIKDKEFLLFKHLIINEINKNLNDDEVNDFILYFIETGLRIIQTEISEKTSLEDLKIKILE